VKAETKMDRVKLARWRKQHRLSQLDLAILLRVRIATISNWERGISIPNWVTLGLALRALTPLLQQERVDFPVMLDGSELRAWRANHGLSQEALGELLDVGQMTISDRERDLSTTNGTILTLALRGLEPIVARRAGRLRRAAARRGRRAMAR
jgi:transcriptional regulator with XRE-family HTH domain